MPTAIVTGASRGLGLALARELAGLGWRLVIDAREPVALEAARCRARRDDRRGRARRRRRRRRAPRASWSAAAAAFDVLVNNASILGPSPQPALADYPLDELERVYAVNVLAPLALMQLALPLLPPGGRIVNVTSDAAVEPYAGWGGYGSSKAALEQLAACSRPSIPSCASTPSIPATCAPACTRRRSRARTSPIAPLPEERARAARADRRRPAERALPRRRIWPGEADA